MAKAADVNIEFYEVYAVQGEYVTADLIIWQRYRRRAPGVLEKMLEDNPHLSVAHRTSPFIPPGTLLRLPIDSSLILRAKTAERAQLWAEKSGYTL